MEGMMVGTMAGDALASRKWKKPGKRAFAPAFPARGIDWFGVRLNGGKDAGYVNGEIVFFDFVPEMADKGRKGKEYDGVDALPAVMSDLDADGKASGSLFPYDSPGRFAFGCALTYRGVLDKAVAVFERAGFEDALSATVLGDVYVNAVMYYARKRHGVKADVRFVQDVTPNCDGEAVNTGVVAVYVDGRPFAMMAPLRNAAPIGELMARMEAEARED